MFRTHVYPRTFHWAFAVICFTGSCSFYWTSEHSRKVLTGDEWEKRKNFYRMKTPIENTFRLSGNHMSWHVHRFRFNFKIISPTCSQAITIAIQLRIKYASNIFIFFWKSFCQDLIFHHSCLGDTKNLGKFGCQAEIVFLISYFETFHLNFHRLKVGKQLVHWRQLGKGNPIDCSSQPQLSANHPIQHSPSQREVSSESDENPTSASVRSWTKSSTK